MEKKASRLPVVLVCVTGFVLLFLALLSLLPFVSKEAHNTSFDLSDIAAVDKNGNAFYSSYVGRQPYLFLPSSFAGDDSLSLCLDKAYTGPSVYVNDVPLTAGEPTLFSCGGNTLLLSFRSGVITSEVTAVRSQNIPHLCIETASGNMNAVHANKEHKETGTFRLFDEDGVLLVEQELRYIKGRGNQTWHYDKRPYNIKLTESASLLGMGKAKEWCLLADYTDLSGLRNKLVYDLASRMGFAWTPSCEYVELWLNGEYAGLYLLAEKITVSKRRVDIRDLESETEACNSEPLSSYPAVETPRSRCYRIPNDPADITGGYILELQSPDRVRTKDSWFILTDGTCFSVKSPQYVSEAQMAYLCSFMEQFVTCLSSSDGYDRLTGVTLSDLIDTDSFVLKYLLEEIAGNKDSEWSSQFFTLSGGVLSAGPCWDYDHSLGNDGFPLANPETLIATWRSRYLGSELWYGRFLSDPAFYEKVCETYKTKVRPLLDETFSSFDTLRQSLEPALAMNSLRWPASAFAEEDYVLQEQAALLDYLKRRVDFLDRLWIDREELICISFAGGGYERFTSTVVPLGTTLLDIYDTGLGVTVEGTVLIDTETDEVVLDLTEPLLSDRVFSVRGG